MTASVCIIDRQFYLTEERCFALQPPTTPLRGWCIKRYSLVSHRFHSSEILGAFEQAKNGIRQRLFGCHSPDPMKASGWCVSVDGYLYVMLLEHEAHTFLNSFVWVKVCGDGDIFQSTATSTSTTTTTSES